MKITRDWKQTDLATLETLFHNGNGYLGVRNAPEEGHGPGSIRGAYINAFYEITDITYGEKLCGFPDTKQTIVNLPDAQTIVLEANGRTFSMFSPETAECLQTLDTDRGVTTREMLWKHPDGGLRIRITRLTSFSMPNVFVLRCQLISEGFEGTVTLHSSLRGEVTNYAAAGDPRVASEPLRCLRTLRKGFRADTAHWVSSTLKSGLTIACLVRHVCSLTGTQDESADALTEIFTAALHPGDRILLEKQAVYTDSMRSADCEAKAGEIMKILRAEGTDRLFAEQDSMLKQWREVCCPRLLTADTLTDTLEYDLYQLLQSTGWDGTGNIAAKGLSGEGYEGHTFWDSEMYVFPWFLWTQPEKARGMLEYRCRLLDKAKENARTLGLPKGALYPWRTISGDECSAFFPAGSAQYHINGDIAYAFLQYLEVTEDEVFMAEKGAAVLVETARVWIELGHMSGGAFRIDCVTGPDEYTCLVNNNFYTNAVAKNHLLGTAALCRRLMEKGMADRLIRETGLTAEEIEAFEACGKAMYFPSDPQLGISAQDDSFLQKKPFDFHALPRDQFPLLLHYHPLFLYRHQVCKQADTVLAHLLFPETADPDTIRRSYEYYQKVTTHDSSLSVCIFGAMAARLGLIGEAEQAFRFTVALDLEDHHGNTGDGLHTANLGGAFLLMLKGFAGLRPGPDGPVADPYLPENWDGYDLPFSFRGSRYLLTVRKDRPWKLEKSV